MSKIANMINMVAYLSNRDIVKIKEISKYLEISERMVRQYKDELEQTGIYIESRSGKNGGYRLEGQKLIKNFGLTSSELFAFKHGEKFLSEDRNYIYRKDYVNGLNKIISETRDDKILSEVNFIKKGNKNAFFDKEEKYYDDIYISILKKNKVKINYYSLSSNENKDRIVHPYGIVSYRGFNYLIAFCELRNRILDFKVVRINSLKILYAKFFANEEFSISKYMNNDFGIVNDEEINIELKIKFPKSQIVKEEIKVSNQEIIDVNDGIIYKAKMKSRNEVISWILSLGLSVEIIKPLELKNEISKILLEMVKNNNSGDGKK